MCEDGRSYDCMKCWNIWFFFADSTTSLKATSIAKLSVVPRHKTFAFWEPARAWTLVPERFQNFSNSVSLANPGFHSPSILEMYFVSECCSVLFVSLFLNSQVHLKCTCVERFWDAIASTCAAVQRSRFFRQFSLGPHGMSVFINSFSTNQSFGEVWWCILIPCQ